MSSKAASGAGHVSGLGATQHREFAMAAGEMATAEFTRFLSTALGLITQHSSDGSLHFVYMDWRHLPELLAAGARLGALHRVE